VLRKLKNMDETLHEIGKAIQRHHEKEIKDGVNNLAVARIHCNLENSFGKQPNQNVFWLLNHDKIDRKALPEGRDVGFSVYKNTPMGEAIIKFTHGKGSFRAPGGMMNIDIHNRAVFSSTYQGIKDLTIHDASGNRKLYQSLAMLLQDKENLQEQLRIEKEKAEKERLEEESRRLEAERRRKEREKAELREKEAREAKERAEREAAEEAARLEAERLAEKARQEAEEARRKEEEARKAQEEAERRIKLIKELEEGISKAENLAAMAHHFIRKDVSLRSQHILDPSQETAKRSHMFDGKPLVIEGGPGTGKTTTMIQRLKFLLSPSALKEYDNPLNKQQIATLTDASSINRNWLFFSPTHQLLSFLRNNMAEEDLRANEYNTTVLSDLNDKLMLSYSLREPEKDGPFKMLRRLNEGEDVMIKNPKMVVDAFEKFCIKEITKKMLAAYKLNTADYSWHRLAVEIKAHCKQADSVKDIASLLGLVESLEDTFKNRIVEIEKQLNSEVKARAIDLQILIEADEDKSNQLNEIFVRWKEEMFAAMEDEEDADDDDDEEEADNEASQVIDFRAELFKNLLPIIRKLGLKAYDSKTKLTKRQKEIYEVFCEYAEGIDLSKIGELAWFVKNYSSICKGTANAVINQIFRLYKGFRKQLFDMQSTAYNSPLLEKFIKQDNKKLHPDELHLLVGFMNRLIYSVYKKSKNRFDSLRNNKYVQAYMDNVKYVIGVDEATDYSWLDYYFITSLRHYDFSSITLCGDSMQGLNHDGISDWSLLKNDLLPGMDVVELTVSYRQTKTLVDMARQMYLDDRGKEAPYHSDKDEAVFADAAPLVFVSDDEELKVQWMAHRIVEVFKKYDNEMPSVAIFVGDNQDIPLLVDMLEEQDCLNSIKIADCTDNRTCAQTKCVRIFRLKEVKGMEFEVAFFHNIDKALAGSSTKLMRRYLYVGISRATSHLAATLTDESGNEDILKYFNLNVKNWKI
jgi:flagellar biosynthesis GTPase FlhF